jgi:hypothetical protein
MIRYRGRACDVKEHWRARHRDVPYPEDHTWLSFRQLLEESSHSLTDNSTEISSIPSSSTMALQPAAPIKTTAFIPVSPSTTVTSMAPLTPCGSVTQAGYLDQVNGHMHLSNIMQQSGNFYADDLPSVSPEAATHQSFPYFSVPQQVYPTSGLIQEGNSISYPSVGIPPPSAPAHVHPLYHPGVTQTFNNLYDPYTNFMNPVMGNYSYNITTAAEPGILCPQPVYADNSFAFDNSDPFAPGGYSY